MRAASAPLCAARVDAPRHAAHNQQPPRRQVSRKHLGDARPIRRRMPRAHHRDRRPRQQAHRSTHPKHRRRIVNLLQPLRILRTRKSHKGCALRRHPRPLLLGRGSRLAVEDELRRLGRKPQPSSEVSGSAKIWLGASSSRIASTIRFGPSPGDSTNASHASRSSSNREAAGATSSSAVCSSGFRSRAALRRHNFPSGNETSRSNERTMEQRKTQAGICAHTIPAGAACQAAQSPPNGLPRPYAAFLIFAANRWDRSGYGGNPQSHDHPGI